MNELLRKRIERRLETLPDEQGYQVLDYVEFLESKYATAGRDPTVFERISEGVEDTLRAGRIPAAAIRGTMGAVDTASRLMDRLAQAGRAAVDELNKTLQSEEPAGPEVPTEPAPAPPPRSSPADSDRAPPSASA
ncbi:MAG: DUF2281 domain-containing protein [Gemmatimonadota bacterium]|nr:DUF2281 domain-containing protein [Gemmatimonadota bacterium]